MIKVNGNGYASCDSCGKSPDAALVHLSHYDSTFTLCKRCGLRLAAMLQSFLRKQ